MKLMQLNKEQIENVYNKHMKVDFPPEELKPLDVIQKLITKEIYICYGLYSNEQLLGYAFLVTSNSYLLIDYYAMCAEYRNKGIGSEFLSLLKEKCTDYNGIIVEVEKIQFAANEEEKEIRRRRIDFYKKNGMKMTGVSSLLFNVNYSIMCLSNIELDNMAVYEGLKNIYKEIIPNKLYSKYVEVNY